MTKLVEADKTGGRRSIRLDLFQGLDQSGIAAARRSGKSIPQRLGGGSPFQHAGEVHDVVAMLHIGGFPPLGLITAQRPGVDPQSRSDHSPSWPV